MDYDQDGDEDLLFINSRLWSNSSRKSTAQLYRNRGDGTYENATAGSGLDIVMYGTGVAVADYDNDGYPDVYITAVGTNRLLRNRFASRHDGLVFQDVTVAAGTAGAPSERPEIGLKWKWSTSAAWLDYDLDGLLDLFVCNYVNWSPETDLPCYNGTMRIYCPPEKYEGLCGTLYRNEGNARFRDVSLETGIRGRDTVGKALGVAVADYDLDGWPDIAVANDNTPNFLFMNQGGRRFIERGVEMGIAMGESGRAKAGMGIDSADWENNGRLGIGIGNFNAESLSLFQNLETGIFINAAHDSGVAEPSLPFLTFGLFFFDCDLDGRLDMFTANGHIDDHVEFREAAVSYRERPQLYWNAGNGRFREIGVTSGLTKELIARGAAFGDIDNDGDLDIAVSCTGGPAQLYRNDGDNRNRWLRLALNGAKSNRQGIGARVAVTSAGKRLWQHVKSGGSYQSESQRDLVFGLGSADSADSIEIRWPSGQIDTHSGISANKRYIATEGSGMIPAP